ncbi:hypothetical protein ADIAG_02197 [Paeniglutamicibacter gangotriensis Lz1y]|uniref:Uncharacterized protein n=1 Tax=Paeniglutamicibacter gangotriensis Lz1y TaxID=1276920 RepID=M7MT37_9MICC|nr:hypothetical protein ADIAG_02197 [Paeniglutamicibacter gangotriensis Lz1y]
MPAWPPRGQRKLFGFLTRKETPFLAHGKRSLCAAAGDRRSSRGATGRTSSISSRKAKLLCIRAEGLHLLRHAELNCCIVQDGALHAGRCWTAADVEDDGARTANSGTFDRKATAVMLTRAHFERVGFAARIQRDYGSPVLVHSADAYRPPLQDLHEKSRWSYPSRYPRAVPILVRMALAGALNTKGITEFLVGGRARAGTTGSSRGHPCSRTYRGALRVVVSSVRHRDLGGRAGDI